MYFNEHSYKSTVYFSLSEYTTVKTPNYFIFLASSCESEASISFDVESSSAAALRL